MKRTLFTLLILVPGASLAAVWPDLSVPSADQEGGEADAAVVVGIEKYPFVSQVPGAAQNADDWHLFLTKTRKVPAGKVKLLRDNEATLEDIRDAASWAASNVQPGGTLWFVFIGHGAPHKDGKEGVLIGVDAQQRAESLYNRSLRQGELMDLLAKGRQARTVALLDACFSGRTSEGKELVKGLQPLIAVTSSLRLDDKAALFMAGKSDQFAGPLPGAGRPAFSYLMLGALRGWAADKDGLVTPASALTYVNDALQTLLKDRRQTPELHGSLSSPLSRGAHEAGPDIAAIARQLRPAGASELSFGQLSRIEVPSIGVASSQGGFKEVDLTVERLLEDALFKEKDPGALPVETMLAWCILRNAGATPYRDQAAKACREWRVFSARTHEAELNLIDDYAALSGYLSLRLKTPEQKTAALKAFLSAYAELKGHRGVLAAHAALKALSGGEASPAMPAMDVPPPSARPRALDAPEDIKDLAFGACESPTACELQAGCRSGKGEACMSFFNIIYYQYTYEDDKLNRAAAVGMVGCMLGDESSCGKGAEPFMKARFKKSARSAAAAWTHGCLTLHSEPACRALAHLARQTLGAPGETTAPEEQGVRMLEAACLQGLAPSCKEAGEWHGKNASKSRQSYTLARLLLAKACRAKDEASCTALAAFKKETASLEKELAKSEKEGQRIADLKAELEALPGLTQSLRDACAKSPECKSFMAACDKKAKDCLRMGSIFENGEFGAPKSAPFGVEFYRKACDANDGTACRVLIYNVSAGKGTLPDQAESNRLTIKACDLGERNPCESLASNYRWGNQGFPKSPSKSFELYKKACDMDGDYSCQQVAQWYATGNDGMTRDTDAAIKYARKSCEKGTMSACILGMNLGDSWSRKQVRKKCSKDALRSKLWAADCEKAR
ncbi:MAG: caspase family protein [Elusimicrobia bacterium]|nr:caspase family protein [Elusimicrobiota bacterium]